MLRIFITVQLLVCFPLCAAADELRLSPDAAVALALTNNPHLKIAELEVKRARSQFAWSGRLANPELELAAATDTLGRGEGEATFEVAFVQKFPRTSRLRDAKEVRRVGVALAEAEVGEVRRALAARVRTACVELAASDYEAKAFERLLTLNAEVGNFLKAASDVGEASPLDVVGAKLAAKALQREVASAKAAKQRRLAQLRPLLGLGAEREVVIDMALTLPKATPPARAGRDDVLARRPDYQAALIEGDVARAELTLAKSEGLEDFALRLFAERERAIDEPGGLEGNVMVGVGVSIPLPIRQSNEAAVESARIDIDRSELVAEALALEIDNQLAAALESRMLAFVSARDIAGDTLELADKNLRDYRDAHTAGQASFVQVQRAQELKLELEKAALAALKDYYLADVEVRLVSAADVAVQTGSK